MNDAVSWLMFSQVVGCLSLLPWLTALTVAFMGFDASAQSSMILPWAILVATCAYPLLIVGCYASAWILLRRGMKRRSLIVTSIPLFILTSVWLILVVTP